VTERPQRISYFPLEKMDNEMMLIMERCAAEGTPRPESSAVRAHSPRHSGRSLTPGTSSFATE